jgi:hypothetical protein
VGKLYTPQGSKDFRISSRVSFEVSAAGPGCCPLTPSHLQESYVTLLTILAMKRPLVFDVTGSNRSV